FIQTAGGQGLEFFQAVGSGVEVCQRDRAEVAVHERDLAIGTVAFAGEDAIRAAAAADVEHALPGFDRHHLDEGACAVVEAAVGKHARPGEKAKRRSLTDARMEGDLVPAPRTFTLAL